MRVLRDNEYQCPDKDKEVGEEGANVVLGVGAPGVLAGHLLHRLLQSKHHERGSSALREEEGGGDPVVAKGVCERVRELGHSLGEGLEEHDRDHDPPEGVDGNGAAVGLEVTDRVLLDQLLPPLPGLPPCALRLGRLYAQLYFGVTGTGAVVSAFVALSHVEGKKSLYKINKRQLNKGNNYKEKKKAFIYKK